MDHTAVTSLLSKEAVVSGSDASYVESSDSTTSHKTLSMSKLLVKLGDASGNIETEVSLLLEIQRLVVGAALSVSLY